MRVMKQDLLTGQASVLGKPGNLDTGKYLGILFFFFFIPLF